MNKSNIRRNSRHATKSLSFAGRFKGTIENFLGKPVFENGDANWIDVFPTITKGHKITKLFSFILTPAGASPKKNEPFVKENVEIKGLGENQSSK